MEKKSSGQRGRIQEGQVRVPLEGELDLAGLSRDLRARGFFLANDPEAMDSQGWDEDYDPEGYYPYWVFRDGKRWVFACPPKDLFTGAGGRREYAIGARTEEVLQSWLPYVQKWCR